MHSSRRDFDANQTNMVGFQLCFQSNFSYFPLLFQRVPCGLVGLCAGSATSGFAAILDTSDIPRATDDSIPRPMGRATSNILYGKVWHANRCHTPIAVVIAVLTSSQLLMATGREQTRSRCPVLAEHTCLDNQTHKRVSYEWDIKNTLFASCVTTPIYCNNGMSHPNYRRLTIFLSLTCALTMVG